MPAQPKHDTLQRLLELLKALPHHGWATPTELHARLADMGYEVDLRSVQRDLKELQKSFPLDHNDKGRPHGWRWSTESAGGIAAMSTPEALSLVLVQQHLQTALPATMLDGFESLFRRARQRLERMGPRSGATRWPDKIRAVPPGLPSVMPTIDPGVQASISEALLAERQIDAVYAPAAMETTKRYRLHPLGLILRGDKNYLAASKGGKEPIRLFAMHRFVSVDVTLKAIEVDPGISLDAALHSGQAQFGASALLTAPMKLLIACTPDMTRLLLESPLGKDQASQPMKDGRTQFAVHLPDSWELRWWLLSRGTDVEVLKPEKLRHDVRAALQAALQQYDRTEP